VFPLFFPGGDIGSLSVHGTINDLAMRGAKPLYLTAGFIIEEGFPLCDLKKIADSMAEAANEAGVKIIAGDTKVVEKHKGDGVFITTTGLGSLEENIMIDASQARVGDKIIISGSIGDHGVAIMSLRENLRFKTPIQSDTAALHDLVQAMLSTTKKIRCLRDPTRGGVAAVLNEIAQQSNVSILIDESMLPIHEAVQSVCELLGLDPLNVANEGKLIAICDRDIAEDLVNAMRQHPLGREAAIIGEVTQDTHGFVELLTLFGGRRIIDWLHGEQLPRIC